MTAPLYTFSLPFLPATGNETRRMHWRVRARVAKEERNSMVLKILATRPHGRGYIPLTRARLVCTRHSSRALDYDGLVSSCKHLIDALVVAGVIVDDSPQHVEREYRWEKAKRGEGRVVVEVYVRA